jgi:hypothetical protein
MHCTTAVSNAGNISWIERRMGSLPRSSVIVPVLMFPRHCILGVVVGSAQHWASRLAVLARITTIMFTSGVL